ncbi:MAG: M23 family metallopeptidase [bacterium]|nr:M23 family metallopeptidase [bacterium]
MNYKGSVFMIVFAALAIVGGVLAVSQITANPSSTASLTTGQGNQQLTTEATGLQQAVAVISARDKSTLADIERQLGFAQKTGGISPTNYKDIDTKLKTLESKKVDTKKARTLLKKLSVGGQEKSKTTPPSSSPLNKGGGDTTTKKTVTSGPVRWDYRYGKWEPSRTPPACGTVVLESPADISKANSILYPGQVRGSSIKDYKAHGGIHFKPGDIEVRVPLDGYVFSGVRFYYQGHIQYGIDIMSECGIMQRFGHLYELTPKFQAIAETFRKPVEGDSRGTFLETPIPVKKGEIIATKIGWPGGPNGFDWGVYDLRKENEAAKDSAFRKTHEFQWWYDYHGLCWLDYLPDKDQSFTKALPGGDGKMGKTSDYCGRPVSALPVSSNISEEVRHATTVSDTEPPLLLKGIGVDLGYFDAVTGKAGDFVFTKGKLQFGVLFTEFGFTIPANQSATGADKRNPQPTFLLPLGTKVRSLVDGVVVAVPKLYSNDYSIQVAPSQNSNWRYETEHVINPLVKVGDTVKAGQVIAEVSPHDNANSSGYGLVEIGILRGGNPPEHICPFAYLDPSIKDDVQKKVRAFYKSWEEYRGDNTLHNESAQAVTGCLSLDPIEG